MELIPMPRMMRNGSSKASMHRRQKGLGFLSGSWFSPYCFRFASISVCMREAGAYICYNPCRGYENLFSATLSSLETLRQT